MLRIGSSFGTLQLKVYFNMTLRARNDHTRMTAPLLVRSAKFLRFSTGENWNGFMRSIVDNNQVKAANQTLYIVYNPHSSRSLANRDFLKGTTLNGCGEGILAYALFYSFYIDSAVCNPDFVRRNSSGSIWLGETQHERPYSYHNPQCIVCLLSAPKEAIPYY